MIWSMHTLLSAHPMPVEHTRQVTVSSSLVQGSRLLCAYENPRMQHQDAVKLMLKRNKEWHTLKSIPDAAGPIPPKTQTTPSSSIRLLS
jgi:hypothetical protein